MKKEVRLAMFGIAIALGAGRTVEVGLAQSFNGAAQTEQSDEDSSISEGGLTFQHINEIRKCLNAGDALCLRTYLSQNRHLLQNNDPFLTPWERNLYAALANFWNTSSLATNRELLGDLEVALSATAAIYG